MKQQALQISCYSFRRSSFLLFRDLSITQAIIDLIFLIIFIAFGNTVVADMQLKQQELYNVIAMVVLYFIVKFFMGWLVFLNWYSEYYQVKHNELIHKKGFLRINIDEMAMEIIEEITYSQTILGRIFDYAEINIILRHSERDATFTKTLNYIPNHLALIEILENLLHRDLDNRPQLPLPQ